MDDDFEPNAFHYLEKTVEKLDGIESQLIRIADALEAKDVISNGQDVVHSDNKPLKLVREKQVVDLGDDLELLQSDEAIVLVKAIHSKGCVAMGPEALCKLVAVLTGREVIL